MISLFIERIEGFVRGFAEKEVSIPVGGRKQVQCTKHECQLLLPVLKLARAAYEIHAKINQGVAKDAGDPTVIFETTTSALSSKAVEIHQAYREVSKLCSGQSVDPSVKLCVAACNDVTTGLKDVALQPCTTHWTQSTTRAHQNYTHTHPQ